VIDLTRRAFIGRATAAAAALAMPTDLRRFARPVAREKRADASCVIVDLGEPGLQRESMAGFESALTDLQIPFARSRPTADADVVIVPGALRMPPRVAQWLVDALENGATVIVESAAVFADAQSREFRDHREMLHDLCGIQIDAPASLWPAEGVPYVEYTWPVSVRVRDFSRAVAVRQHEGEVIGRVAGLPVAVHQCRGSGTLIFLGSPLGPALWSGDAEARRWLSGTAGTADRARTA
jgi:hypothetical protein